MKKLLFGSSGDICYGDRKIGEHVMTEDGKSVVRFSLEYTTGEDWIVPLSWLAHGLAQLPENHPPADLLTVTTSDESITEDDGVQRYLIEKLIRRGGHAWKFHRTDPDSWPSNLHGHDYQNSLILDVLDGAIYDSATRLKCGSMKNADLDAVRQALRKSKDFEVVVNSLIGAV
ncbi:MAG TPA: hypothetical protein VHW73_09595 [Rudaea sp.]|nr:hypothetical protein [Rudaea sp.]